MATLASISSATLLGVDGWPVTVEVHVSAILKKAGSGSCRELVARLLGSPNSIS